ncbi:MAG: DNA primase [Chitinophagales bacterium]|nr:DNA primase [Chitinophagales bacterium]
METLEYQYDLNACCAATFLFDSARFSQRALLIFEPMISQRSVSLIMETASITEVVGEYVKLKKRGANYLGLCPFHNEKTPSFTVSAAKGFYHCFGCGKGGNAVNFLMEHDHFSYPEALRHLAEKYHIEIEETKTEKPEDRAEENLKESILIANGFAQNFYAETLLNTEEGIAIGISYFKERGFREDTLKKFQLGFSPNAEAAFYKEAIAKGYNEEILAAAGLITEKDGRKKDFFRERVLFPIHNFSGKVIGFGGRTLKSDKNIPKYKNSAQTAVYDKSKSLYGIFFAKNTIRKLDECILVEGYTDVISLSQAGIENVVSSSGTSLTTEQAKLIKRLTNNIVLLYDGDQAGLKAALRGIDILLEEDLNVRVVALPEPEDPDSFVKTNGAAALREYITKNVSDFILFKTKLLLRDAGSDPFKKAEVIKDIVASISIIPDAIKRSVFLKECSNLLSIDENVLISETNKLTRSRFSREANVPRRDAELISPNPEIAQEQRKADTQNTYDIQERDIIRLLLEYGTTKKEGEQTSILIPAAEIVQAIVQDFKDIPLENATCNLILHEFTEALNKNAMPEEMHFINHTDKSVSELAIDVLLSPYEISHNWLDKHGIAVADKRFYYRQDIKSSMSRFKLKRLKKMEGEYLERIKTSQDEKEIAKNQSFIKRLRAMRMDLAKDTGTVIPG